MGWPKRWDKARELKTLSTLPHVSDKPRNRDLRSIQEATGHYGGCSFRGDLGAEATLGWVGE